MCNRKSGWLLAIAAVGALACGGDQSGPSVASLVGTWRATKAEVVSAANPSTKVDLVAMGGTVRLVLTDAKTFTLTSTMPGAADDVTTGTWTSSIDMLRLAYGYGSWECDMTLTGNSLSLGGADTDYDFNGDDVDEPAKWYLTLVRE
jgi:hypothetical protein